MHIENKTDAATYSSDFSGNAAVLRCRDQKINVHPQWIQQTLREDGFACNKFRLSCGMQYATWLIGQNRTREALIIFSDLTAEAPDSAICASAWYWLALEAHSTGDTEFRNHCAHKVFASLPSSPIQNEEWKLLLKASLILKEFQIIPIDPSLSGYGLRLIEKVCREIFADLALMPKDAWAYEI